MTLMINQGADVFTADSDRVGSVDRIVIDPLTKDATHIVVRRGVLFREDKVIPIDMVSSTDETRIVLHRGVSDEEIPPFEERHFVPVRDDEYEPEQGRASIPPLMYFGPYALPTPVLRWVMETMRDREIPERAVAVETGASVVTSDGLMAGSLDRVLTTDDGIATHLVIDVGSAMVTEHKGVPVGWIESIDDDGVRLGVPSSMIDAIPYYDTDAERDHDVDVPLT